MRKVLMTSVMALTAWVMLSGCATAEERAARAAEQAKAVKAALQERNYQIAVNRMYPLRGASKSLSYGYSVEVCNDSLISYLRQRPGLLGSHPQLPGVAAEERPTPYRDRREERRGHLSLHPRYLRQRQHHHRCPLPPARAHLLLWRDGV